MTSKELRQKFIEYFISKGHKQVSAASLIPENDPSVLFTTAGMQQFKRFYISPSEAPSQNVTSFQPCFRTSDIEEVGDDTHGTFFEMLGNFSFGGYFKKEAIEMAYEFLTKNLSIDPNRIYCSVFAGDNLNPRDDESAKILESMGLKYKEHSREDNFWGPTGQEGPCGPTVELYVDDIEIWNLVFNEYYREIDGSYKLLESKGIDTGMGFERALTVTNNLQNVYETDLFESLILKIEDLTLKRYMEFPSEMRIIADHLKAATFAINDGILPSNKDQGYVVRRLIRRAIVKAYQLGLKENFIKNFMTNIYPIYDEVYNLDKEKIEGELEKEENKFRATLIQGLKMFEKTAGAGSMPAGMFPAGMEFNVVTGRDLFDLYQTYGFPLELSLEIIKDKIISTDETAVEDFKNALKQHQDLSRTASAGMFKGGLAGSGEMETKYHTATHLLLAALRKILGNDVNQKGANITAERIRFDFNYAEKLTDEQIKQIEVEVNKNIQADLPVDMREMSLEDAQNCGATGTFTNKYGEKVKVYQIGEVSKEICGGPHVENTGILGHFKITKEESSSAGIRRIKAVLE